MKYAWIDAQRREYSLPDMCEVLAVSISGYRAWLRGGKPDRTRLTAPQGDDESLDATVACAEHYLGHREQDPVAVELMAHMLWHAVDAAHTSFRVSVTHRGLVAEKRAIFSER